MRAIAVAVPVPGIGALTYAVPDEFPDPPVGARVLVPVGNRTLTGIVLSAAEEPRTSISEPPTSTLDPRTSNLDPRSSTLDLKPLIDVLDAEAFLPAAVVDLAAWVADYYACGIGEAIATAMPPRAWVESERHAAITEAGEARLLTERGARREALEQLSGGRIVSVGSLARRAKGIQGVLAGLEADGLVTLTRPLKGNADASRTIRVAMLSGSSGSVNRIYIVTYAVKPRPNCIF